MHAVDPLNIGVEGPFLVHEKLFFAYFLQPILYALFGRHPPLCPESAVLGGVAALFLALLGLRDPPIFAEKC